MLAFKKGDRPEKEFVERIYMEIMGLRLVEGVFVEWFGARL